MEKVLHSDVESKRKGDLVALVGPEGIPPAVPRVRMGLWDFILLALGAAAVGVTLTLSARLAWPAPRAAPPPPALVCYYPTPRDARSLQPAALPARLCTHVNVAFARVRNKSAHLEPAQLAALRQVVALKRAAPALKVLLSVGGAGDDGFADMVVNHASRKQFIRSIKYLLRNYTLDGIDLDWEFPTGCKQRQHFSQLLREIRMEYDREHRDYLLTVAVAAEETIADASYDYDQLNYYVDFVNVMTYDYHFYTRLTPFTGFNSPLYAEPNQRLFLSTLNVNYTMHMYLNKGIDPEKLVVGIPTYGHSFELVNPDNTAPGSPATGPGALGTAGFVSYPDVCEFLRRPGAVVARDAAAAAPYAHGGREWLSYDDEESVTRKAQLAARLGLRGAMLYSLDADDHSGVCARRPFPLAGAARRVVDSLRAAPAPAA